MKNFNFGVLVRSPWNLYDVGSDFVYIFTFNVIYFLGTNKSENSLSPKVQSLVQYLFESLASIKCYSWSFSCFAFSLKLESRSLLQLCQIIEGFTQQYKQANFKVFRKNFKVSKRGQTRETITNESQIQEQLELLQLVKDSLSINETTGDNSDLQSKYSIYKLK